MTSCPVALALVVLATVVAGCAGSSDGTYSAPADLGLGVDVGSTAPAAPTTAVPVKAGAKGTAKAKPDGIARRLSRSCRSQLRRADTTAAGRIAEHRGLKQEITATRRDLKRRAREQAQLRVTMKAAYRRALAHRTNANVDAYNALVARGRAAVSSYNARVDALNRTIHRANALAHAANRAQRQYERTRDTCLRRIRDWAAATRDLTAALPAPAAAAGRTTPLVVCEHPEAPRRHKYDKLGYVQAGTPVIHLAASTCLGLERVRSHPGTFECATQSGRDISCPPGAADAVFAIVVLAHEEQHIDGVFNEAQAQCYAYQRAAATARKLGVGRAVARSIARFTDGAFDQPPEYHSSACHAGGTYDLGLPAAPARWSY